MIEMAKCHRIIVVVSTLWATTTMAEARPQYLEIEGGDTAFVVDTQAAKAWWLVGDCKRTVPVEVSKSTPTQISSRMIRKSVTLGARQVELRQQFRFTLGEGSAASVDVFNSVRGGWSPVPVRVDATCTEQVACRARMELPECASTP